MQEVDKRILWVLVAVISLLILTVSIGSYYAEQWDTKHVRSITLTIPTTVDLYSNTTTFPIDNYTIRSVEIRQNEIEFKLNYIED